jgi:hypothetical protein
MSPCESSARMSRSHEPLRPIAIGVLRREDAQQQVAHRLGPAEGEQHLERALANVARAPTATRELLQAARREVVHERVVQIPGHDLGELRRAGVLCVPARRLQQRRRRRRSGHQFTADRQAEFGRCVAADANEGQVARAAVCEQHLVAADAIEAAARCGCDAKAAFGETLGEAAARRHRDEDALLVHPPVRRAAVFAVVARERDVQAGQHRERWAGEHVHMQPQRVRVAVSFGYDPDDTACMLVDPSTRFRPHLERRGHAEQLPAAVDQHENAQPLRAELAEPAAHGGEKTVDADMPLRHHRMKDAGHPRRRGQRCFVGFERVAAAQDVAVRALDDELLRAQHDVRAATVEERQQRAGVIAFLLAARGAEQRVEVGGVEVVHHQHRRAGEQRACGRDAFMLVVAPNRRLRLGQSERGIDRSQVSVRSRVGVMRLHAPKETEIGAGARCECQCLVFDRSQRVLVLQPRTGQALCQAGGLCSCARRDAEHL